MEPGYILGFRKDTNFLKNEIGFSIMGDFKIYGDRTKTIVYVRQASLQELAQQILARREI